MRVGPDIRSRSVEQSWVLHVIGSGLDGVAKTDVNLHVHTRVAEHGPKAHPQPTIFSFAADRLGPHGRGIQKKPVVRDLYDADVLQRGDHVVGIATAVTGEIEVAGRPVNRPTPYREQHGALENEASAVWRLPQAIEKPFGNITVEEELKIVTGLASTVEKPVAN